MAVAVVTVILVIDQIIKIWVKTNMTLHEQIEVFSWFKIVFIENNGMAYGMEIGSKLVLSLFRVVAVAILGCYIAKQVRKKARWGYLVCLSMVMAGAAGNIFDSMFYGLIFNASSEFYTSYFVPFGTGYAPFLMGKVVERKKMKHSSLIIVLLTIVMIGCKPTVPKQFIQPGDLEDILYDYHVAQAMAIENRQGGFDNSYNRNAYFQAVLKKHGVTEAEFDSSLVYYYSHAERLRTIYQDVRERLNEDAKALGASVGDLNKYSQYSSTGDTANVWQNETDLLLIPQPTQNRYDIYVKADTSYYKGDTFMFQFMSDFIYQSGSRDAVVCLLAKYEGDSITQTVNHITITGQSQVRIPQNRDGRLKELRGYIYLNNNEREADVRKMLFISQIQLIRFHQKKKDDEPKTNEASKADSLRRVADSARVARDTTRRGDQSGERRKLLPADKGTAIHRMDQLPAKPTRR